MKTHLLQALVYILLAAVLVSILVLGSEDTSMGMGFVQPDSPLPEPNPAAFEYAKQFEVSIEEAPRRLGLQFEMAELASQIAEQEPSFGGSWLQHKPDLRLFIAFASPDGEKNHQPVS